MKSLRHLVTNSIIDSIPNILNSLFTHYGTVEYEVFMDKEAATRAILYGIKDPLVTVYDAIEELEMLGIPTGLPYYVDQFVVFVLKITKIQMTLKMHSKLDTPNQSVIKLGQTSKYTLKLNVIPFVV